MPDISDAKTKAAKILMLITVLTLIFSLVLPEASAPAPQLAAVLPLRVHVVDDNQDAAQTLALLLQMDGHEVSMSFDAQASLAYAASHEVDVFVLDIGLPDMDGTELAQRLRAMPAHAKTLIVALTGYGQAADRARSLAAGFDHHLVKPVNYDELSRVLAGISARSAATEAAAG